MGLEEQLLSDLNSTLSEMKGELGEVKSTLRQYEKTFEDINLQILRLNKNINCNNITIAKATGFVTAVSFMVSIVTVTTLSYFKII